MNLQTQKLDNELAHTNLAMHAVGAVVATAILVGAHLGIFGKLTLREERVRSEANSLRSFLDQSPILEAKSREAKQLLEDRKDRLDELFRRIPSTPQESDFLGQMSKLARSAGVEVREYNPGDVTELDQHSMLEVDVAMRASYRGLCRFLYGLAHLPRLCQVAALRVQTIGETKAGYPVKIQLRIFFAPVNDASSRPFETNHA